MSMMVSQISGVSIVCSIVCSGTDKKKTSKLRVTGIFKENHRWPGDSLQKGPVTQKMFLFDDVIMVILRMDDVLEELGPDSI